MVFRLSNEDILKVCTACSQYKDEYCQKESKPVSEIRRCPKWNEYYGDKCVRG